MSQPGNQPQDQANVFTGAGGGRGGRGGYGRGRGGGAPNHSAVCIWITKS